MSPVSLTWSTVCLLGREHVPGRPSPNPIPSQAMGGPGMDGDKGIQDSPWGFQDFSLGGEALGFHSVSFMMLLLGVSYH